jgi:hypothetical protein
LQLVGVDNKKEEMEVMDGAAMAEKLLYPPPLLSHEEVANDRAAFMDTLRRFHSLMGTKFMYYSIHPFLLSSAHS